MAGTAGSLETDATLLSESFSGTWIMASESGLLAFRFLGDLDKLLFLDGDLDLYLDLDLDLDRE